MQFGLRLVALSLPALPERGRSQLNLYPLDSRRVVAWMDGDLPQLSTSVQSSSSSVARLFEEAGERTFGILGHWPEIFESKLKVRASSVLMATGSPLIRSG